jgi:hypothetical protein
MLKIKKRLSTRGRDKIKRFSKCEIYEVAASIILHLKKKVGVVSEITIKYRIAKPGQ